MDVQKIQNTTQVTITADHDRLLFLAEAIHKAGNPSELETPLTYHQLGELTLFARSLRRAVQS